MNSGLTRFKRISTLLVICMQLYSNVLFGQFDYVFNNFNREDGLPTSEVYGALQDDEGFMWFCTDQGVAKYNGFDFEIITINDGLLDNVVIKMHKDKFGRIWFIGMSGTLCYLENGTIIPYEFNHVLKKYGKGRMMIKSLLILPNGDIVIGTTNHRSVILNEQGELKLFESIDENVCMTIDENNYKHLLMYSGQSKSINKQKTIFVQYKNGDSAFFPFKHLFQNHSKFIALDENAYALNIGRELHTMQKDKHSIIVFDKLILDLFVLDNYLWVTTMNDGVIKFKWENNELIKEGQYLKGHSVSSIFKDDNNSIWLTTTDNGVYYIINERISVINNNQVKTSSIITRGQELFIGYMNHQLIGYDLLTNKEILNRKMDGFVHDLEVLTDNRIVVSSEELSIISADLKNLKIVNQTESYYVLRKGLENGLMLGRASTLIETTDFKSYKVLVEGRVYAYHYDDQKRLIYSIDDGVFSLDTNGNRTCLLSGLRIKFLLNSKMGLLAFDETDKMYLVKKNEVKEFDLKPLLDESLIRGVQLEGDTTLWIATNDGIFNVRLEDEWQLNSIFYGMQNGLYNDEIEEFIVLPKFFIIRTKDVVIKIIRADVKQQFKKQIKVENLFVNEEQVFITNNLNFPYNKNDIRIDLSMCMLNGLGQNEIEYSINNKVFKVKDNTINLLNLEPGEYQLKFNLMNSNWSASLMHTSLSFTIEKPFWNKLWFYFISAILISFITFLIVRYLFVKQKQSALQNELIVNYQQKALLAQMKPHFIYNSLNSIQTQVLKSDKFEAHKYISKFGELIRKNLEWSEFELISLKEELELIHLYVDLEQKRMAKQIVFNVLLSDNIEKEKVRIPPFIIQPIIENSFWHGINIPSIENGKISLEIAFFNDFLHFTIIDNGIGIDASMKKNKEKHLSMSSKITIKRIKLLESKYNFNSNYTIVDLSREGITGTKVEFVLPKLYA